MISIVVLTKNEESDITGCLESVAWSDDIHVLDSISTDDTVRIANDFGAHVTQRQFDSYAAQRNASLRLPFRHSWVLVLDADERVPGPLAEELQRFASSAPADVAAARLRRRDFLGETWLKHAQISPFYIRLLRPERASYIREVNEVVRVEGLIVDLKEPFDHFPFSKGLSHWIEKHNRYSSLEAELIFSSQRDRHPISIRKAFFCNDFNERRFHQKEIFYRLPCRPIIKWLYMLIGRRAFLDGRAGWTYAWLQMIYESMIVLKTRELQNRFLNEEQAL